MPSVTVIEEIKDRLGIVDVISPYVPLKKAGRSYKGLCPFHTEKTPSFIVTPDKGNYHCFGCGANGDVFTFIMKVQNLDFPEALRVLAERAGVTLPERGAAGEVEDRQKARLYEANATAAQYFHYRLLSSEAGRAAREYLAKREITTATIEAFQLGFAPDSWDALSHHLRERGFAPEEISAAGLTVEREDGHHYDRFRARLAFPVRDAKGRVTGFGARALGSEQPKYLNTPQTALFDKGGSLYGIDLARSSIREADKSVVVEGYVDAIVSHQSGVRYVVACLGTAITERQVRELTRLSKHLVLALDPDVAGDEATLRGLDVVREAADRAPVPVFDWRGAVHFERKLDADIRVASLPRGKDPDEVIRENPDAWPAIIAQAQPVVDFVLNATIAKANLSDAKEKEAVVERLLPLLGDLGPGLAQEHYVQRLAQLLHVGERGIFARLRPDRGRPAFSQPQARQEVASRPSPKASLARPSLDQYLLALFLRYPSTRDRLWELAPDELNDAACRQLYATLQQRQVVPATTLDALRDGLDPVLADVVALLLENTTALPTFEPEEADREVIECLNEIRRRNLRAAIDNLNWLLREAEEGGDAVARRQFIARHEEILAELTHYEHVTAKARFWRW